MRLLNTTTLQLEEFWDSNIPKKYAILSHTWGKEEVSFQDIKNLDSTSQLVGFSKIQACCEQAVKDDLKWAWIDTCCIDKSSSAELSESINSMFRWYEKATICYAYLSDVAAGSDLQGPESSFFKSRWFTRGWTLQELIAPREVEFFSNDWNKLGSRSQLSKVISQITRIGQDVLRENNKKALQRKSIAQKMSWASRRETTRSEDTAYCLLGLFEVNMALLYGEGANAFIRLQKKILKRSNDQSLFAWTAPKSEGVSGFELLLAGFLASSPAYFEHSHDYIPNNHPSQLLRLIRPYSMTNMGLCIDIPLFEVPGNENQFMVVLLCSSTSAKEKNGYIGLFVFVDEPGLFQSRGLFGSKHISDWCKARRDAYQGPTALRATSFDVDRIGPYLKIDWDARHRGIKAHVGTLYVPQNSSALSR
jgi:hypothetical protein